MNSTVNSLQIWLEVIVLYIVFPLLFLWDVFNFPIMLVLVPVGLVIYFLLKRDPTFDNKLFFNWNNGKRYIKPMLWGFVAAAIVMLVTGYLVEPTNMFLLIKENPWLLLIISVFYPLFSVVPQALAYRALFFHRYAHFFKNKWLQIFISAVLFSFGHILYKNWIVLLLTFIAGIVYAYRYYQSKSLALSILEHALYGVWLFTSGLGMFFISHRV
jgi:uncharacterized protein